MNNIITDIKALQEETLLNLQNSKANNTTQYDTIYSTGMLIDGSDRSQNNIDSMLSWDVNNGIARRAWARNPGSISTIIRAMDSDSNLLVTIPNLVDSEILQNL